MNTNNHMRARARILNALAIGVVACSVGIVSAAPGGNGKGNGNANGYGYYGDVPQGNGNGNGNGNKPPTGPNTGLQSESQCASYAMWVTSTRNPNGASPFSGYMAHGFSNNGGDVDETAWVIRGEFPAAAYGGWFVYPETYDMATSGATFPNVIPDSDGSKNPYTVGEQVLTPKRNYTLVITPESVTLDNMHPKLRNLLPADPELARKNHIIYPFEEPGVDDKDPAKGFILLARVYEEKAGYTRGGMKGQLNIDWPKINTYDLEGNEVPCAGVQPTRDFVEGQTPWNTVGYNGIQRVPFELRGLLPGRPNNDQDITSPKPDQDIVDFYRPPRDWTGWPGGVVPNPTKIQPDRCANYITARLDEKRIALVRVPRQPTYAQPDNTVNQGYDVGAYNMQIMGRLRSNYVPGSEDTFAIGNEELKTDSTGGMTFMIWPRTLGPVAEDKVLAYAKAQGWNVIQGNLEARNNYVQTMILRQNGSSSLYRGGYNPAVVDGESTRRGVPCMDGPSDQADDYLATYGLAPVGKYADIPGTTEFIELGADWAAQPIHMGPYTPQGVQCHAFELLNGDCHDKLVKHIGTFEQAAWVQELFPNLYTSDGNAVYCRGNTTDCDLPAGDLQQGDDAWDPVQDVLLDEPEDDEI